MKKLWMRAAASALSLVPGAVHGQGSPPDALPTTFPTGTEVELMVLAEVNTRTSVPGSIVRLRVNKPVSVDGRIALAVGTPAFGKVEAIKKSGLALSRGTLGIRLTHIDMGGAVIPLADEQLIYEAKGGKGDDAAKLLLVPFYAPFSPGNSAKVKAGELIHAHIAERPSGTAAAATAR